MSVDREDLKRRAELGSWLRHAFRPRPDSLSPDKLSRLEAALGEEAPSLAGWLRRRKLAGPVLALAVSACVIWVMKRPPAAAILTYRASPALTETRTPGATFTAPGDEGDPIPRDSRNDIRFADGSVVSLKAGASASVSDETSRGARVTVAAGRVHFKIQHRNGSQWSVIAGPFTIHVTGTEFLVDWSASASKLKLDLLNGSVRVEGASVGAGLPLSGRQALIADLNTGDVTVSRRGPAPEAPIVARAESPSPTVKINGSVAEAPALVRPARQVTMGSLVSVPTSSWEDPGPDWESLLAHEQYDEVLRAAEALGTFTCLARCSASAKFALADAARYRNRNTLAARFLEDLGTSQNSPADRARADYLLGRLNEAEGNWDTAARKYQTCAASNAEGPYAALALGRLLAVAHNQGQTQAAQAIAQQYLSQFLHGPHADLARRILGHVQAKAP